MFLELQLSVHELKNLLQSRIRALPDLTLADPVGPGFVDRVRVGQPAFEAATGRGFLLRAADGDVPGRRLRARVPLTGTWVSERALLEAGHRPADWGIDHAAEAVVELDAGVDSAGRPALRAELIEVLPPLDLSLPGMVRRLAGVRFAVELPVRFPHETLLEVLIGGARMRAAALSADLRRGIVALRVEPALEDPEPVARWAPFLAGRLEDHLGGSGFAMFTSASLLERTVRAAMGAALLGEAVDLVRPAALPEVSWSPSAGGLEPGVRPRLIARSAPLDPVGPPPADAVLTLALDPVDEALTVEASLPGDADDATCRAMVQGILGLSGTALTPCDAASRPLTAGGALLTAVTSLLAGLAAPLLGSGLGAGRSGPGRSGPVPLPGPDGRCAVDRRLPAAEADLVLTAALGAPDGLVLRGRLERNRPKPDPELHLEAPEAFRWAPETCTSAALATSTVLRAHNPGSTPLHVCNVRALTPGFTATFDRPVEIACGEVRSFVVTGDPGRPVLLPTVCEILVQTTGGTRIVTVPVEPVSHLELLLAPLQRMAMCVVQAQGRPDLLIRPVDLVTGRPRRAEPDPQRLRLPA